ncbi:MAG: rod shape-determining protein MreC [Oligoflexales bacterium]
MPGFKRQILGKVLLVCSLLSPFVVFSSGLKPWVLNSPLGTILQEIVYPLEYVWDGSVTFVANVWNQYFDLSNAAKENAELKAEMNRLSTKLLRYDEQENEISRLRKLLGFMATEETRHVLAEVVGSPRSDPFHTIRISKGYKDGLEVGMPVVTAGGVVGKIIRTGVLFSDVQLLVDNNFYLDVLLQRTRVRGVLKGLSGQHCELKLNRRSEIRIGDTIITSGIVGGFPKGVPVGKVVRISYEADNVTQAVLVEPWVDHQQVEEVVVLMSPNRDVSKILETVGKNWLEEAVKSNEKG